MCRAGGPRCDGSRKAAGSTATATVEVSPDTVAEARVSEERQRVDELAAALPADRVGYDGKPLDDSARRLYALRESGYTGPIDQDGYPDTTSDSAGILRRMAHDRGETVDW